MNSFKSLLPSLILILIYFIADEFFGPKIGIACALVLGSAEFIYTRIREKIYDKMLLLTTLFFCIPGAITLLPGNNLISRLQPAIVESALAILLGFFAFSRTSITASLPASYRKNINLSPGQEKSMRNMLKTLFALLCLHTLLSYASLLWMQETTAAFITGPLLYILFGLFFIVLFARSHLLMHKMKSEEWLPVVNEKGEITGKAPRRVCHSGSMLLHPVVHLHITNERHELFLQKRSMKKDLLPGKWDTAVGGHIGLNEKVEDALKRETFEELGITDFEARFIGNYVWKSPREHELVFAFVCTRHSPIHIDNDEVDEGKFWNRKEIENGIATGQLTPNLAHEYTTLLRDL